MPPRLKLTDEESPLRWPLYVPAGQSRKSLHPADITARLVSPQLRVAAARVKGSSLQYFTDSLSPVASPQPSLQLAAIQLDRRVQQCQFVRTRNGDEAGATRPLAAPCVTGGGRSRLIHSHACAGLRTRITKFAWSLY
jgi:hypothetical protein